MPLPKFSSRYPDVKDVLDKAIAAGGARYRLKSGGKATNWRQRAYHFRKLLWAELNANSPVLVPTPYDGIRLTVDPLDATCVIIQINNAELGGTLEGLDGGALPEPEIDPLEKQAADLRNRLMGL